jgi:hypothetical protein
MLTSTTLPAFPVRTAWRCLCGKVYAPHVNECAACSVGAQPAPLVPAPLDPFTPIDPFRIGDWPPGDPIITRTNYGDVVFIGNENMGQA